MTCKKPEWNRRKKKKKKKVVSEQPRHKSPIEPIILPLRLRLGRRARQISRLLAIDLLLTRPEIRLLGLDPFALGHEFIPEDEDQIDRDPQVRCDELLVVEVAPFRVVCEHVERFGQGDDDAENQGAPGAGDAQGRLVRERGVGDVLGLPGPDEVDVCDEDGDPGQEAEDGDQVDEVFEDGCGVAGDVHVGE